MKSIFVGNLSVSVTEAVLDSLFEAYGTVERVSIMTDPDTGQAKGFGFVDMSDDGEADKAIAALNGKDVEGRTLSGAATLTTHIWSVTCHNQSATRL